MFNYQKNLHTSSLPAPVNTGKGNDQRRGVVEYKAMTPAEFLGKIPNLDLLGRTTVLCDMDLSRDIMLLRQMMGYLQGVPRMLVCSETQLAELEYLKRAFPAGVVANGCQMKNNGICTLPVVQPLQVLKDILTSYPDVYIVLHLSRITLDVATLNLLNSLALGYMLLIDRDPCNMMEKAEERNRLFCTDYVFAGSYPGNALQYMSENLWTYEKLVTQHITNRIEYPGMDPVSVTQMNSLHEFPVFTKYELTELTQQGKFLIADRLRQKCYVSDIFTPEPERRGILRLLRR